MPPSCITGSLVLPNPSETSEDGINHCHLPRTINRWTARPEMNSDWWPGIKMEEKVELFLIFLKNLLRTRNISTLALPRWFWCQDRSFTHAGIGWSQRVKLVSSYLRVKCDFSEGPLAYNVSRWAAVTSFCRTFTSKRGLCTSYLVNLLSR